MLSRQPVLWGYVSDQIPGCVLSNEKCGTMCTESWLRNYHHTI